MKLNELKTEAFSIAKANGWHDKEYSDEHLLMLVITEIGEAINADRKGNHADEARIAYFKRMTEGHDDFDFKTYFEQNIKDTFEDECADVVIRLLDLADLRSVEIEEDLLDLACENYQETTEAMFSLCKTLTLNRLLYSLSEIINAALFLVIHIAYKKFNLIWHIEQKMKYNKLRGYHHGGKKY